MLNQQKGLSLIGILAAIFITSMGLVAALALANMSVKGAALGEMRLIASGLAQEGIEIVRDTRRANSNWIDWEWYGGGGTRSTSTDYYFTVQYDDESLTSISGPGTSLPLKIDSNGFYQYDSGTDGPFYREITLTKESFEQTKVIVEISWQLKGRDYTLIAEDHLWKWK